MIILAAGMSSRFGRNKLLEELKGRTVIERVLDNCIKSKVDRTTIVLGFEHLRIKQVISHYDCTVVLNPRFQDGQSSSIKAGLRAIYEDREAVLISPGDVPLITHEQIDALIENFRRYGSKIAVTAHNGEMGHPILFDSSLFAELLDISEEGQGLKEVIKRHTDQIAKVEVESEGVLLDIDTEKELLTVKRLLEEHGSK